MERLSSGNPARGHGGDRYMQLILPSIISGVEILDVYTHRQKGVNPWFCSEEIQKPVWYPPACDGTRSCSVRVLALTSTYPQMLTMATDNATTNMAFECCCIVRPCKVIKQRGVWL